MSIEQRPVTDPYVFAEEAIVELLKMNTIVTVEMLVNILKREYGDDSQLIVIKTGYESRPSVRSFAHLALRSYGRKRKWGDLVWNVKGDDGLEKV